MSPTSKSAYAYPHTRTPIHTRKLDLLYLLFFLLHIPTMLLLDLYPLYPPSMRPHFLTTLRQWYITSYSDQFFVSPPAWFGFFLWMEAGVHVPVSVWAVGGLVRDDPMVPVHLLILAVQTAVTTGTCIVDFTSWTTVTRAVKMDLAALYVPYLVLAVFMGVDVFGRLKRRIGRV